MKCKICGKRFRPKNKNRYLASAKTPPALSLVNQKIVYECFDCPACGCQNKVNTRLDKMKAEKAMHEYEEFMATSNLHYDEEVENE